MRAPSAAARPRLRPAIRSRRCRSPTAGMKRVRRGAWRCPPAPPITRVGIRTPAKPGAPRSARPRGPAAPSVEDLPVRAGNLVSTNTNSSGGASLVEASRLAQAPLPPHVRLTLVKPPGAGHRKISDPGPPKHRDAAPTGASNAPQGPRAPAWRSRPKPDFAERPTVGVDLKLTTALAHLFAVEPPRTVEAIDQPMVSRYQGFDPKVSTNTKPLTPPTGSGAGGASRDAAEPASLGPTLNRIATHVARPSLPPNGCLNSPP
jgi:hypothetical protein